MWPFVILLIPILAFGIFGTKKENDIPEDLRKTIGLFYREVDGERFQCTAFLLHRKELEERFVYFAVTAGHCWGEDPKLKMDDHTYGELYLRYLNNSPKEDVALFWFVSHTKYPHLKPKYGYTPERDEKFKVVGYIGGDELDMRQAKLVDEGVSGAPVVRNGEVIGVVHRYVIRRRIEFDPESRVRYIEITPLPRFFASHIDVVKEYLNLNSLNKDNE